MYWSELLDHAQGVMIFEGMENSRASIPMTDESGMRQFRRGQKQQMDFIWDLMFPWSLEHLEEVRKQREEFKAKRGMYKELQDKINRERGFGI